MARSALYLEEPEFWTAAGYEPHFKLEWQQYYHEPWQDPESSPEAQYRSSKLKYFLYRRALADVFKFVREYGHSMGRNIKCYVATHSLINYSNWGIVSPESSLLEVGCDGYIAQVWTGTVRSPNFLDGAKSRANIRDRVSRIWADAESRPRLGPRYVVSQRSRGGQSKSHLGGLPL